MAASFGPALRIKRGGALEEEKAAAREETAAAVRFFFSFYFLGCLAWDVRKSRVEALGAGALKPAMDCGRTIELKLG
jgi:hypothetical protein